jgi:ribosome-associated protein
MSKEHSKELSEFIAESIDEKKGNEIVIIDVANKSDYANYLVLATAESDIQLRAIANWVKAEVEENGLKVWRQEGMETLEWVILDYSDVVVHLFNPDSRKKYDLEKMWADAEKTQFFEGDFIDREKYLSEKAVNEVEKNIQSRSEQEEN